MFIDTHAHLLFPDYRDCLEEVINRALINNVKYIINVSINLEDSIKSISLFEKYQNVFISVGIHPNELKETSHSELKKIKELAKHPGVIAIGEVGLDYYRKCTSKELQQKIFAEFINLSEETGLPLIIHTRYAWGDIEKNFINKMKNIKGVFHCFSGNLSNGLNLIENGFYLSYTGNITYRNFKKDEILRKIPIERVMIETDSPFLTPEPYRGQRNEPAYVVKVAEKLSSLFNLTPEDIGRITSYNAYKLFGIAGEILLPKITYKIRHSLYINVTNRCSSNCVFCERTKNPVVKGHNLKLKKEPTVEETIEDIRKNVGYNEIVFCGYGEPTIRLDYVKDVARWVKSNLPVKVRLNTNGQGNLINNRNIVPELKGLIDVVSISLNAETPDKYLKLTRSIFGKKAYSSVIKFIKECRKAGFETYTTIVNYDDVDVEKCRAIAEELDVNFRVRNFKEVG
ncbi:radical SAM protein [candidate division KSB1 bacterium]|nr:MAG: radical SAM protein [candidate division KSB1 bacterium]